MSIIKLNKASYHHNIKQIALKTKNIKNIICVLKNNAYGHGIHLIAPEAKNLGIDFIALKNEEEAYEIKELFSNILILSHIPNGKENNHFIYAVNSINDLYKFKKGTKIHLAIDTGMHRNGILMDDLEYAFVNSYKLGLIIDGIFTHFMGADELDSSFFIQKKRFEFIKIEAKALAKDFKLNRFIIHSHNSSALFRCDTFPQDEFCRIGLAQFGYCEFGSNLKKVLSLFAHRLSNRILYQNQNLGYGAIFKAEQELKIATYDLGYADGLLRFDGKKDLILENGYKLLGKMSMDSFSCEDFGEELCVFKDANIWARFFNTIEYEILAKLSSKIKRIWI